VRSLVPWTDRYIDGDQTMVVRNRVGGSGVASANAFAEADHSDGLTILATSGSLQVPYLLGDPLVKYDYNDWTAIFAAPVGGVIYVPASLGVTSAADFETLAAADLTFGAISPTSLDIVPLLAWELLGLEPNVVFGMESRANTAMSTLRGETNLDYQTTPSFLSNVQPLVEDGTMVPLFTWGVFAADGTIQRDPTFPDLPSFPEFCESVHGAPPSGPAWDAYRAFYASGFGYQKLLVVPRAAPAERIAAYRNAMTAMAADPAFVEEMEPEFGAYEMITGDALDAALEAAITVPDEAMEWMRGWLLENFEVAL
jgi:tripartite-type tricarboxylate transporter receptor subunit TctC